VYRVAEEVARLLSRGITLFDQVLFPELARMAADLELSALMRTAGRAALGIGIIGLSLAAIVVLLGPTLLSGVLDAEFAASAGLAALLLLASALLGVATPFYSVFYALFRPATAIAVRAVGVISFIGLFFALAGQLGLPAIGWAALIAAGLEVILASLWATGLIRRKKAKAKAPQ
jgi:O-antigen/teichoic acid export membrane protein